MCIHTKSCVYHSRPPPIGEAIVLTRVAVLINEGNYGELNYALHVIGKTEVEIFRKKISIRLSYVSSYLFVS